jgi:NodT family efflux transporter outer membrane factor (OMF) lipoprotein
MNLLKNITINNWLAVACTVLTLAACSTPQLVEKNVDRAVPPSFGTSLDSTNTANVKWRDYFTDPYLVALIDTALQNNQELNIVKREIEISLNEVMARKGEYLPFVSLGGGAGLDKVARYTSRGASEATTDIEPEREMPEPLPDFLVGASATWEVDIWHKLRNAKKAALTRYLASIEGRNFLITKLIAEIANSYYELLALDNQLDYVKQNIGIQTDALEIVKIQKEAARATELAVKKFEAEVFATRSLQFDIEQKIIETENRINFLIGRFPQPIARNAQVFNSLAPMAISAGIPTQLLENRPDIRQAELNLQAAKIDVQVAKANFYPSLGIRASLGLQAFNPAYWAKFPESLFATLTGELIGPLVNKKAITANYLNANAMQVQAIYNYERTVLNAYIEVANQVSNIHNLAQRYDLKSQEVEALNQSINISNDLFKSARADYMEVLMTQRDVLESRFELVETKMLQLNAYVNIYQALGGGWQ